MLTYFTITYMYNFAGNNMKPFKAKSVVRLKVGPR